jgi:hypothetical protein
MQGIQEQIMINVEPVTNWVTTLGLWVSIAAGVAALIAAAYKAYKWYS